MESALRFSYYEAGAVAHNVMIESAAWNYSASIVYPINDNEIRTILGLNESFIPQLINPVGD